MSAQTSRGSKTASKRKFSKDKSSKDKSSKGKSSKGKSSKDRSGKNKTGECARNSEQETILNLWCAIYNPHFGNYYHWAFAVSDATGSDWHIFEVTQQVEDGPFTAEHRRRNPTSSMRCRRPLTFLGQMHQGWWTSMVQGIRQMPIGEAPVWNCQDYVMEIWNMLQVYQMIDEQTWDEGRQMMMPYFGPDFGGIREDEEDDYEDNNYEEGGQRVMSEEFVYDSDE